MAVKQFSGLAIWKCGPRSRHLVRVNHDSTFIVPNEPDTTMITGKGQASVFAEFVHPRIRQGLSKRELGPGRKIDMKKTRGNSKRPNRLQIVADHDWITHMPCDRDSCPK